MPAPQMKIADFGAACIFEVSDECAVVESAAHVEFKAMRPGKDAIGTPCNMAPEVLDGTSPP